MGFQHWWLINQVLAKGFINPGVIFGGQQRLFNRAVLIDPTLTLPMYACTYIFIYTYVYTYFYVCMYVCIYIYMVYIYIHMCVYVTCFNLHVFLYIYIYIMYLYIHIRNGHVMVIEPSNMGILPPQMVIQYGYHRR